MQIRLKMEAGDCPPLNMNAMRNYLLRHSLKFGLVIMIGETGGRNLCRNLEAMLTHSNFHPYRCSQKLMVFTIREYLYANRTKNGGRRLPSVKDECYAKLSFKTFLKIWLGYYDW